jgi:tetratricopeptide (TPR) repeat protein
MLSEEALVLIGVVVAVGLLILGVLELIAPSRSRYPRRRGAPNRDPWRRARTGAAPARPRAADLVPETTGRRPIFSDRPGPFIDVLSVPPRPKPAPAAFPPAETVKPHDLAPVDVARVVGEPPARREPVVPPPAPPPPLEVTPAWEPERVVTSAGRDEVEAPGPSVPPVERCYALYEAQQFTEVVSQATAALEAGTASPGEDAARLWGVVGLARQALGEPALARAAFEAAIAAAPPGEHATWERHLAVLALRMGRERSAWAENPSLADGEERLAAIRDAIKWLERGLQIAPEDEALGAAQAAAREALWPAYERVGLELIQRQDYDRARQVLQQALAAIPAPPADLEISLRELLSGTYGGEVGQLTAEALRRMRDGKEAEALATLKRAEELLAVIPEEGLPERRRQELERRLWWSYTKVGIRWLEGDMYEEALSPLLHALRFGSVGPNRLEETRRPLIRALENLVDAWHAPVERLTHEGSRHEAQALCERLWGFIHDARAGGMTEDELAGAITNTQALFQRLGVAR